MRAETRYIADDGTEFIDASMALKHDALCSRVMYLMLRLKTPKLEDGQYFQHPSETALGVQQELLRLFAIEHPDLCNENFARAELSQIPVGNTIIGRYFDDCASKPLRKAWGRIMCMDKHWREWNKPFYALQAK